MRSRSGGAAATARRRRRWEVVPQQVAGTDYRLLRLGDREIGGMIRIGDDWPAEVPPHWLVYLEVKDIAAAMTDVLETGGTVLREPFEVPGVGQIAIVREPSGAAIGLLEPAPQS